MPNPIAHPAASIAFTKAGLVFSALVMGSLSPDVGYLGHFTYPIHLPTPYFTHAALGIILFDVPMGFALLWLFHALMKWPLLSALPESLKRRLFGPAHGFSFGPPKRLGLILLSLLVGSSTHVIWDSFTHEDGWLVEQFSFLRISMGGTPLYTILQNLGTILGIFLLAYWFIRWLPMAPQSDQLPARFSGTVWTIFFALAVISLTAVEGAIIYWRVIAGWRFVPEHFMMDSITVSAAFITLIFVGTYCVAWTIAFRKTVRRVDCP